MDWNDQLEAAADLPSIFGVVKEVVEGTLNARRSGLMLGIQELGAAPGGAVGAYYPTGSNLIVLNNTVLKALRASRPKMVKPFLCYVILHEYLHSLGIFDELETRKTAARVSRQAFGSTHIVTDIAVNPTKYFPKLQFALPGSMGGDITLVKGFDSENQRHYA